MKAAARSLARQAATNRGLVASSCKGDSESEAWITLDERASIVVTIFCTIHLYLRLQYRARSWLPRRENQQHVQDVEVHERPCDSFLLIR